VGSGEFLLQLLHLLFEFLGEIFDLKEGGIG